MQIAFPYGLDARGLTARTTAAEHVCQMVEQVLLTMAGERVNRPDFGCGLPRLVFSGPHGETLVALEALVRGALQQNLSDVIRLEGVSVVMDGSVLAVTVGYVDLADNVRRTAKVRV